MASMLTSTPLESVKQGHMPRVEQVGIRVRNWGGQERFRISTQRCIHGSNKNK